jgi:NAD(P)H-hydrate epimerase
MVIDADALNALAARTQPLAEPAGPRILTPHPGEFARLAKEQSKRTWDEQAQHAEQLAKQFGVVIVLKGHHSQISDGTQTVRITTGNPGMATGGTGDVLTGIITALVCQQLSPFEAAYLGCHLHGLAGDLAAGKYGEVSMIARDLLEFLPAAFQNP